MIPESVVSITDIEDFLFEVIYYSSCCDFENGKICSSFLIDNSIQKLFDIDESIESMTYNDLSLEIEKLFTDLSEE